MNKFSKTFWIAIGAVIVTGVLYVLASQGIVPGLVSSKSTLFRALAGMTEPTHGSIDIYTGSETLSPVREGLVGFVQQNYPLSRNQTVMEMLMQTASIGKIPGKDQKSLVLEKLEEWGLSAQANHAANQLSGGQKQRVAILEQILCSKHFFIMDEPFSGLDVKNKRDAQQSIERITQMNEFNTVIFSTHEIELAVELADHIIVIGYQNNQDGSVRNVGTVIEQYDLKAMGLAWSGYTPQHAELQKQIEETLVKS